MGIFSFSYRLASTPLLAFFAPVSNGLKSKEWAVCRQAKPLSLTDKNPRRQLLHVTSPKIELVSQLPPSVEIAAQRQTNQISACSLMAAPSRLKVIRLFEPGLSASCAGRMLISGKIADVCAELERMEQRSAGNRKKVLIN